MGFRDSFKSLGGFFEDAGDTVHDVISSDAMAYISPYNALYTSEGRQNLYDIYGGVFGMAAGSVAGPSGSAVVNNLGDSFFNTNPRPSPGSSGASGSGSAGYNGAYTETKGANYTPYIIGGLGLLGLAAIAVFALRSK